MKFIVDDMFGNIGRWLRTLGYDTIYAETLIKKNGKKKGRDENILIHECFTNHRILITGDMKLIESLEVKFFNLIEENPDEYEKFGMAIPVEYGLIAPCIFLTSAKLIVGLKKIYQEFNINLLYDANNARCSKCNHKIEKIPEGVYRYQKDFWICTNENCKQIYWKGRQIVDILEKLKNIRSL